MSLSNVNINQLSVRYYFGSKFEKVIKLNIKFFIIYYEISFL